MKRHFAMMANYNQWANARLYNMSAAISDGLYRKPVGVYFRSLHGTLNHLLTADRIWMHRLAGTGEHPDRLDATIHDDFASLRRARQAEDQRIVDFVTSLEAADFEKCLDYKSLNGTPRREYLREVLAHLFNHQTHHRGQAHAALTILGVNEPEPLDLLRMLDEKK